MLQLPTAQELPRKLGEEEIATLTGEVRALAAEREAGIIEDPDQRRAHHCMADTHGDPVGLTGDLDLGLDGELQVAAGELQAVAGELGSDAGEHRERAASVGHGPTGGTEGFDEAVTLTTELHEVCSLSPKRVLVKRLVVVIGGVDCGQATIGAGHRRRAMRRARPQRSTGTGPGGGWPGTRGGVVPIASTVDPRFGPGGPQGSGRLTSGNPQAAVDDGGHLL